MPFLPLSLSHSLSVDVFNKCCPEKRREDVSGEQMSTGRLIAHHNIYHKLSSISRTGLDEDENDDVGAKKRQSKLLALLAGSTRPFKHTHTHRQTFCTVLCQTVLIQFFAVTATVQQMLFSSHCRLGSVDAVKPINCYSATTAPVTDLLSSTSRMGTEGNDFFSISVNRDVFN